MSPAVLDLSPRPAASSPAAPPARRVLGHARTEALLLVRNGEQLLLALVIPVAVLMIGHWALAALAPTATLAPSVLALALWSSAFTSVAIATGFERRYGVLERLAATPLGRRGLLIGKALAISAIAIGQIIVLAGIAALLGWRPAGGVVPTVIMIVSAFLAVGTFCTFALLLAGTLRAEITLALGNLIYLVLAVVGAVLIPLAGYPAAIRPALALLPTAAWGEAMRAWSVGATLWWPPAVLAVWLIIGIAITSRAFRWTS